MRVCDVVSIHTPLHPETEGVFDRELLEHDEARRLPDQHRARQDLRPRRGRGGAGERAARRLRRRRVVPAAGAGGPPVADDAASRHDAAHLGVVAARRRRATRPARARSSRASSPARRSARSTSSSTAAAWPAPAPTRTRPARRPRTTRRRPPDGPATQASHPRLRHIQASGPSHSGFWAVPSWTDVVLKGSNSPGRGRLRRPRQQRPHAPRRDSGRNVRTASSACSSTSRLSMPVITTDVGRSQRVVQALDGRHDAGLEQVRRPPCSSCRGRRCPRRPAAAAPCRSKLR